MQYAIIVETGANTYSAYVPDLPGCVAAGDTLEEVMQLMQEAIEFHIESLREHGEHIPMPTSLARTIEIAA
jgi:predicted RNase H-like HicB family nuclease